MDFIVLRFWVKSCLDS